MPKATLAAIAVLIAAVPAIAAPPMVVVDERTVMKEEPAPHGGNGLTTAYRISDAAPGRTMEFRKRILPRGGSIGLHVMGHDEVYYVLSGTGEVTSDGVTSTLSAGMAAYLYAGSTSGLVQKGDEPLVVIVSYPIPAPAK